MSDGAGIEMLAVVAVSAVLVGSTAAQQILPPSRTGVCT